MSAVPEVRTHLTKGQAVEKYGGTPAGMTWHEGIQEWVPLGFAIREDSVTRGENLEERLSRIAQDRRVMLRFIAEQLVEAEYGNDKKPLKGKMHDYYTLPGYDKKTPTKQGGEKLAQFFNLRRAKTESVERVCTKEFAMAAVRVELVDKWGQPAGSGEAAATSSEGSFQAAAAKYGQRRGDKGIIVQEPDWRAAFNDLVARAGKRAFIQAIIYATATDDIFDTTGAMERAADSDETVRPRFPEKFGDLSGKFIEEVETERLVTVAEWCRSKAKNPRAVAPILEAVTEELERRRIDAEGEIGEPPR